jgi:hypothetical protein
MLCVSVSWSIIVDSQDHHGYVISKFLSLLYIILINKISVGKAPSCFLKKTVSYVGKEN